MKYKMVVENKKLDKLKEHLITYTYNNISILDKKEYNKTRKELIKPIYLPVLLRRLISVPYYELILDDYKLRDKIHQTSNYNRREIIEEFIEWCEKNNYTNLINLKEEKRLRNTLKEIHEEMKYLKEVNL